MTGLESKKSFRQTQIWKKSQTKKIFFFMNIKNYNNRIAQRENFIHQKIN